MKLESPAFEDGARIPPRYTCDGEDISPPLKWADAPAATRSFALFCINPDAPLGTWRHWGIFNIPTVVMRLEAGCPIVEICSAEPTAGGPVQGRQTVNDFESMGYAGPCPMSPDRDPNRYRFVLWALDVDGLDLPHSASCLQLENAARPHVLAEAELVGIY